MRRIFVWAIGAVVLCDILSAVADRAVGFSFGWRGPLLLLIYAGGGHLAGRRAGLGAATLVGVTAATTDSVGAVFWMLGSGRVPPQYVAPNLMAIAIGIALAGGAFGALGGLLARVPRRPEAAA